MSDEFKMDFSADIETARKKRVEAFKLNINNADDSVDSSELGEADAASGENQQSDSGSSKKVSDKEDSQESRNSDGRSDSSEIDTEAPSRMMADDFSDKYSLHKYTDAEQVNENEALSFDDEPGSEESDEISSFSNSEQRHKMYKEEKEALKKYKKSEKARQKEKAEKNGCMFRLIWLCMVVAVSVVLGMFVWNGMSDLLGINRPSDGESVILDLDANTTFDQVVDMLTENDLIKNEGFFPYTPLLQTKQTVLKRASTICVQIWIMRLF